MVKVARREIGFVCAENFFALIWPEPSLTVGLLHATDTDSSVARTSVDTTLRLSFYECSMAEAIHKGDRSMDNDHSCSTGMNRREFLKTMSVTVGGVLAVEPLMASKPLLDSTPTSRVESTRQHFSGTCVEDRNPAFAMPGRFPGKVIEVHGPGVIIEHRVVAESVQQMIARGMKELTGAPDSIAAWRSLFQKGDRVGIKVNGAGFSTGGKVGAISNFATILAIVKGLGEAGIAPSDIILFERYAEDFRKAGYEEFVQRELPGVQWYASGTNYNGSQLELDGRSIGADGKRAAADPHVLGYDPAVFTKFDFCHPKYHDSQNPESYLTHVSKIVTGDMVNKIITIPVLKDHRSGGITMALKNISHGMANNVARTHVGKAKGENRCGVFIPQVAAMEPFRRKVVLNILDGLIGVYEGGPIIYYDSWSTWECKSLFFATDPVALDHVGWDVIDTERARHGWQPVAEMGVAGNNRSGTEQHYLRQPEHVERAGRLGLGVFDSERIEYRKTEV